MNQKREAVAAYFAATTAADTLVRAAASKDDKSQEYRNDLIQARRELIRADTLLKRLLSKPSTACDFQGCHYEAARMHVATDGRKVKLCETHSATSALPAMVYERKVE